MKISELEEQIKDLEIQAKEKQSAAEKLEEQDRAVSKDVKTDLAKRVLGGLYSDDQKAMREKREEIMGVVKTLSDDEKLIMGEYMYSAGIISGCNGFGTFKNPTTCGGCHAGKSHVKTLSLEKYVEYVGDRVHRIPENVFDKALAEVAKAEGKDKKAALEKNLSTLKKDLGVLSKKHSSVSETLSAYELLQEAKVDYEKVEEQMPEFMKLIKGAGKNARVSFATAKPEQGVGVILTDKWAYYGTGGCEYGVDVIVFRDGEKQSQYFKYRDPYQASRDDYSLSFKKAEIIEVTDDKVTVKLHSNESSRTRTYELKKKSDMPKALEAMLSEEEQEKFEEQFEKAKKDLAKQHYRENARMAMYHDLTFFEGVIPQGTNTGELIPYRQTEIVDAYIEPERGSGVIVLKAQIDHGSGRGKQFEWVAYKITQKGAEQITRDCAYELELKEGKRIDMNAGELYKAAMKKKAK